MWRWHQNRNKIWKTQQQPWKRAHYELALLLLCCTFIRVVFVSTSILSKFFFLPSELNSRADEKVFQFNFAMFIQFQFDIHFCYLLIENYSFFQWTNSFRDEHEVNLNSTQKFRLRDNKLSWSKWTLNSTPREYPIYTFTGLGDSVPLALVNIECLRVHGREIRSDPSWFHFTQLFSRFAVFFCHSSFLFFSHSLSCVSNVHSLFYIPILQIQGFAVIWHRLKWLLIWRWQIWDFRAEHTIVVVRWKVFTFQYSLVFLLWKFFLLKR